MNDGPCPVSRATPAEVNKRARNSSFYNGAWPLTGPIQQVEFIRGDCKLHSRHRGCVAAFGGFDGLHLGHRAVIERALALAGTHAQPSTVVLFEPLPREFLDARAAPPRLYPLRERVAVIESLGVERIVCLRFNARVAAIEAEEFIERVLVARLGVRALVVGEGFRFGRGKEGDVALLDAAAARHGFTTECVTAVRADSGRRVSSTWVREVLTRGDFTQAAHLLGRAYSVGGRVVRGHGRGAQLGFPTANLALGRRPPPLRGVFAVLVEGAGAGLLPGVANAGYRPTFGGGKFCFEVHLPGFSANLYGRRLRVRFLEKMRNEQRFGGTDELKSRVREDVAAAIEVARARRA